MSTTELHRTAFDEVQREAGANGPTGRAGRGPRDFGDPVAEHLATRNACNLWDESPLRKWDMRGADALALADALFTNDMSTLELGQVRYGAICDEQGKMIMDGTVFRIAPDHCLSITSYDSDLAHFRAVCSDRGLDVDVAGRHRRDAPPAGPGPARARGAAADHRGRRRRCAALLPLRRRRRHGRRRAVLAFAHRLLGRAGLRALLPRRGRGRAVARRDARRRSRTGSARSASRRSRRCGSSRACCSRTSTTSPTRPIPSRSASTTSSSSTRRPTSSAARRSPRSRRRVRRGCSPRCESRATEVPEYGAAVTRRERRGGHRAQPLPQPRRSTRSSRWPRSIATRRSPGSASRSRSARARSRRRSRRCPLYDTEKRRPRS